MNQYRFILILSPSIEINIIENEENIPLKFLKESIKSINNPQSNIIFYKNNSNCKSDVLINDKIVQYRFCIDLFNHFISEAKFPVFFSDEIIKYKKNECIGYDCGDLCCKQYFNEEFPIYNEEKINDIIKYLAENNYKDNIFKYKTISPKTINDIVYIIGKIHGVDEDEFTAMEKIDYREEFFDEIKYESQNVLKNILFSTFRGIIYPSSRTVDRKKNSIDVHPNNPKSICNYNLYRIDVVNSEQSGLCNSGKNRVLIGKKEGRTMVIAYTNTHEFSMEKIKARLQKT